MTGQYFLHARDTSIVTAISVTGNKFTIYGKVKSYASNNKNYAIFAILISGELDGDKILNLKTGLINIDNKNGGASFIDEGKARIAFDNDFVSPKISPTQKSSRKSNNYMLGENVLQK